MDNWAAFTRAFEDDKHIIGKENTVGIEFIELLEKPVVSLRSSTTT